MKKCIPHIRIRILTEIRMLYMLLLSRRFYGFSSGVWCLMQYRFIYYAVGNKKLKRRSTFRFKSVRTPDEWMSKRQTETSNRYSKSKKTKNSNACVLFHHPFAFSLSLFSFLYYFYVNSCNNKLFCMKINMYSRALFCMKINTDNTTEN